MDAIVMVVEAELYYVDEAFDVMVSMLIWR